MTTMAEVARAECLAMRRHWGEVDGRAGNTRQRKPVKRIPATGIADVVAAISADTGVPIADIMGRSKREGANEARRAAMYAAFNAGFSRPEIAHFWKRDPSTVWYAIDRAERESQ